MSLYDDLNAEPDASPDELKSAYRQAAKRSHPDAGGDRETFEKVNRAWLVLSDPARRERYDRTGATEEEPDNTLGMATAMMSAALQKALERARGEFETNDLVAYMIEDTRAQLAKLEREIREGQKALARTDKMIKRARYKGAGQNLIAAILKDQRGSLADKIGALERSRAGFEMLIKLLADYDWEVDEADQLDIEGMLAGAGPTSTRGWTTSSSNW